MDEGASSSSIFRPSGSPAIDRYNPIISDSRRLTTPLFPPKPSIHHQHENRKTAQQDNKNSNNKKKKKKSSAAADNNNNNNNKKNISSGGGSTTVKQSRWSGTLPGDFISPPASSRYLLNDQALLDLLPGENSTKSQAAKTDKSSLHKSQSSVNADQVVVLRVSLHCRGCERKMRKHISRMQGVTSFNIDFAAKTITVIGDVTPIEVLASISKVKNAQLWPPPPSSTVPQFYSSNNSELKKFQGA